MNLTFLFSPNFSAFLAPISTQPHFPSHPNVINIPKSNLPYIHFSKPMRTTPQPQRPPRNSRSPTASAFPPSTVHTLPLPQMETMNSIAQQSLKSSIISDSEYNSMIYEWRKVQTAPIVRMLQLANISQIDSNTGMHCQRRTVRPEPIMYPLMSRNDLSKAQLLYVMKRMLEGHQSIFKKMKATSVSLEKVVVDLMGEVRVWVNQHMERNEISGEILNSQESAVRRIFEIVCLLADKNKTNRIQDFIQYVNSAMKRNGKWTFVYLKALMKSYIDCLKIKLPKTVLNSYENQSINMQKSLISSNNSQHFLIAQNQSSFNISNRNIHSVVQCASERRQYCLTQANSREKQRTSSPFSSFHIFPNTCKSINQKTNTFKSLNKGSKNYNSISGIVYLQGQHDEILQNSGVGHNIGISESRSISGISGQRDKNKHNTKRPSINEFLLNKNGISPLLELQEEYNTTPSASKLEIKTKIFGRESKSQNLEAVSQNSRNTIVCNGKSFKDSSISTTNQTTISGNYFNFSKKAKDSNITVLSKQKQIQSRTASRDRFKQMSLTTMTDQSKKIMGSCTNWSHYINVFQSEPDNKNNKIQYLVQNQCIEQQLQQSLRSSNKVQLQRPSTIEQETKQPVAADFMARCLTGNNQLALLCKEFKSVEQLQSFSKSQERLPSQAQTNVNCCPNTEQKLQQLLTLSKKLTISTHLQPSCPLPSAHLQSLQQTLNQLLKANQKQQQIINQNCWSKKLSNLLSMPGMKQSFNVGQQQVRGRGEVKLSKLGGWGRDIGASVIQM